MRYFSLVTLVVGAVVYKDEDVCMYVYFAHVHRRNKQAHSQVATSYVKHCILFIEYAMLSSSPMSILLMFVYLYNRNWNIQLSAAQAARVDADATNGLLAHQT